MHRTFVCIDSGGTKSIACVVDASGNISAVTYGGPTNALFVPENDAKHAVREAVLNVLNQRASKPTPVPEIETVYLSAPGFLPSAAEQALRPICPNAKIVVEGDDFAAFRGALPFHDGLVACSGTGSFACGLWEGRWETIGGWGPLLGDEGSGYWIGLEALKAVALAVDERGPKTTLQAIFKRTLHYSFDVELRRLVYSDTLNRQRIAGLTLLVKEAAKQGDEVAHSILSRAGEELALLIRDLAFRMKLQTEEVVVSATGGVMRPDSPVLASFQKGISELLPNANYQNRAFEPWVGAVLRTLELSGVAITSAITENISASAKNASNACVS